MKGRMPFPDPLLPIALMAMVIAMIVPTCLRVLKQWNSRDGKAVNPKTESANGAGQQYDPFADKATQVSGAEPQIKIKAKFVLAGSRTEEINFDWIVPTNPPITEPGADGNRH